MAEYSYLHKNYLLQVSNTEVATQLSLFDTRDLKNVQKYQKNLFFDGQQQPLREYFDSLQQFVRFISSENNYYVQFFPYPMICLKWSFVGENFKKQKQTRIFLEDMLVNQQQKLLINDKILQMNKRKHNASQKIKKSNIQNSPKSVMQTKNVASKLDSVNKKSKSKKKKSSYSSDDQYFKKEQTDKKFNRQKSSSATKFNLNKTENLRPKKTKKITKQIQTNKIYQKSNSQINKKQKRLSSKPKSPKQQQYLSKIQIGKNKFQIKFKSGDYYEGELVDNAYNGYGFYRSKFQETYHGGWKNGLAEGFGVAVDKNGNRLEGVFTQDKRYGWGINDYKNGQRYQGNFEAEEKSGWGKHTQTDGSYYQGYWKNDLAHGKGRYYCKQDQSIYLGKWRKDVKQGMGILCKSGQTLLQKWRNGSLIQQQSISQDQKQKFETKLNLKPPMIE